MLEQSVQIIKKHRRHPPSSHATKSLLRELELLLEQYGLIHAAKLEYLQKIKLFQEDTRNRQLNIRRDPIEPADLRIERDTKFHRYTLTLIKLESQRRSISERFDPEIREMETKLAQLLSEYEALEGENANR